MLILVLIAAALVLILQLRSVRRGEGQVDAAAWSSL